MKIIIRKAEKEDCKRMMELVHELAVFERAPKEVTVDYDHFVESGFGEKPVWWALVAEVEGLVEGFGLYYIRYSTWKGQRINLSDPSLLTGFMPNEEVSGKRIFFIFNSSCKNLSSFFASGVPVINSIPA